MKPGFNDSQVIEHEEAAKAKRVFLVDENGNVFTAFLTEYDGGEAVGNGRGGILMGKNNTSGLAEPIFGSGNKLWVTLAGTSVVLSYGTIMHGAKSNIGTSQVQLASAGNPSGGVTIQASPSNTDTVYVGKTGLTATSADATDGYPLEPGDSIYLHCNTLANIYLLAASGTQRVTYIAL